MSAITEAEAAFVGITNISGFDGIPYEVYTFVCPCTEGGHVTVDKALGWNTAIAEFYLHRTGE